ncbi:MAG: hypothetical protein ACUVQI_00370 [Thermochromatium sp.]
MNWNAISGDERRLLECWRTLGPAERETLFAFAEFLVARSSPSKPVGVREPRPLARPAQESVIGAIKRLSESYDMLERDALLHETAALMSAHVLQGRAATEVIDELEALFARHYREYRARITAQD